MPRSEPVVTMNIKRQFFAAILARPRRKRIEYRDMGPYWDSRLAGLGKRPFRLRLLNGMQPPVPEALVAVRRLVRNYRYQQYELHLGRVLAVRYWDRERERPRARRRQVRRRGTRIAR